MTLRYKTACILLATFMGLAVAPPVGAESHPQDPLDEKLWGLQMINAIAARSITTGDKRITVGVMDTGIDASHPDIAPNFNHELSRVFAPDIPDIDGPCEAEGCLDDPGTDDGGHGTHVAGTIGAALNGMGVSGVAPDVSLVNLKAGQDSGFFFLEPVVNALRYAADTGIDIINMSFYVDPWLYNCGNNPADSPEEQAEQRRTVVELTEALTYAHEKGVTLIAALGNESTDLGAPGVDAISPNYPAGKAHERRIDNKDCLSLPAEGPHVIGVSALGPSGAKSGFSNYGTEQTDISAPGGWRRDGYGTDTFNTPGNMILSTYPLHVLQEEGLVDSDGEVTSRGEGEVEKDCVAVTLNARASHNNPTICGYYRYLNGTSMAAPHVAGAAALVASVIGVPDSLHPGALTANPDDIWRVLRDSARKQPCPEPRTVEYTQGRFPPYRQATCHGEPDFNGFYGYGVANAAAAVAAAAARGSSSLNAAASPTR